MKKTLKKALSLFFASCFIILTFAAPVGAASEVAPQMANAREVNVLADVSSGTLTAKITYKGISGVTSKVVITTYIQKKTLGLFWTKVDIGQTDNEWVDTVTSLNYSGTHSHSLPSTGTYRAVSEFVVYGSAGSADKETRRCEVTYS